VDSVDHKNDKIDEPATGYYNQLKPSKKKVDNPVKEYKEIDAEQNSSPKKIIDTSNHLTIQANTGFEDIVKKWKSFIESISVEKGLTLAPALVNFNLISLSDNNLNFSTESEADINTFKIHEKYLAKKSEEFFGRRFNFIFSKSQVVTLPERKSSIPPYLKGEPSADPYEKIILNELGGEKIS
jgi:hypothetical protein